MQVKKEWRLRLLFALEQRLAKEKLGEYATYRPDIN
jgi:hypothetical protein